MKSRLLGAVIIAGAAVFGQQEIGNDVDFWPSFAGSAAELPSAGADTSQLAQAPQSSPELPAADAPEVDELALRFFARQGDKRRLEAEISRLKALYPNWQPPENPLSIPPNRDTKLDMMWELYAKQRYGEVRKAIAERQAAEPQWIPPEDLLQRLSVAEARERLVNASDLQQYETVVRVGSEIPSLLTCSDLDVLWRVAEAFAKTGRQGRAKDVYSYVVANCDDANERLATMQKAIGLLPRPDMDALLAAERTGTDGKKEFATIRAELARQSVDMSETDPKIEVSPADLALVETLATQGNAPDALLLGWYNLTRNKIKQAEEWFRKAYDLEDDAKSSQGLALALIALSRSAEAEAIAYDWRDEFDELLRTYLAAAANLLATDPPPQVEPSVLERIVETAAKAKDPATAQQLGWYAFALNQYDTAARWFGQALAWKADDEPSAFGLLLSRERLGDRAGVAAIQRTWAGRSTRIADLGRTVNNPRKLRQTDAPTGAPGGALLAPIPYVQDTLPTQSPPEAFTTSTPNPPSRTIANDRQSPRQPPRRRSCATSNVPSSTLSPAAALDRGWCLMDVNRPLEAVSAFEAALRSGSERIRSDAAYGQSLAYLRAGLLRQCCGFGGQGTTNPASRQGTRNSDPGITGAGSL